jgi:hypothetical protein
MKSVKNVLRLWIAGVSVAGFLGGWALLAHAPKPVPLLNPVPAVATLPPLQPLPSINSSGQGQLPFFSQPSISQPRAFAPRLRTGGS